jgi:hypothetical protein
MEIEIEQEKGEEEPRPGRMAGREMRSGIDLR